MGFVEDRFPTDISYGSSGGPEYATDIVVSGSGVATSSCIARFDTALNFRDEPHVPGTDKMMQTATTRSDV